MKADKLVQQQVMLSGEQIPNKVEVSGETKTVSEGDRKLLSVKTSATVRIRPPVADLSPFNVLVLNMKLDSPFDGSMVTRFEYSTRAAGMAQNDTRTSVLHFNQPGPWEGWQRVVIPAENLVATGFPDGWKGIEAIVLSLNSRTGEGWVTFGDVELLQVRRPRGPRMSDETLLKALDLDRPGLKTVARRFAGGDVPGAIEAYAAYLRRAKMPPTPPPTQHKHYRPAAADDICRHYIMEQQLPRKIDWQCNPIGYLEWNHAFNRHTWMGTLAAAFHSAPAGKQRKYARELDYLMRSWIEQNPEPIDHNGGLDPAWETLSTSCRINWSWPHVLKVAQRSKDIRDRTLVDMAKMCHAHAEHLLKYWGHCNWFISESTAILTVAAQFPEFRRAEHWMQTAMERLEREMPAQVFPDGVQFELSPGYHTMCANLFYLAHQRAGFAGREFSQDYRERLMSMFDYLARITRPDGTYPVMNDAGTCLPRLLEVGRAEKNRGWIWAGSGGQEGTHPTAGSVHFPDAGYAVMRSGWDRADRWAFIDMGAFGAAHQHEDKLQVEFYAYGTPFLVDPGISSYQNDPVVNFFRRGEAHNTVCIDGKGQWRAHGSSRESQAGSSRGKNLWVAGDGLDMAQGRYDGPYGFSRRGIHNRGGARAEAPIQGVVHTRALVFVRPDYWLVLDRVEGKGTHDVSALWHFTPMHVRIDTGAATVRTNRLSHANIELICRGDWQKGELELVTGREEPVQGFIAIDNEVKPAPCAVVSRRKRLPLVGATVVVPYATGSESHFRVKSRNVKNGETRGLLIQIARPDGSADTFLWRHEGSGRLEAGGLTADGLLAAARTDGRGEVLYVALVDGTSVQFGGTALKGRPGEIVEG